MRFISAALLLNRILRIRFTLHISMPLSSTSIGTSVESVLKVSFLVIYADCDLTRTDNILITKDGYENLTTAVKDVAEMEKIINRS